MLQRVIVLLALVVASLAISPSASASEAHAFATACPPQTEPHTTPQTPLVENAVYRSISEECEPVQTFELSFEDLVFLLNGVGYEAVPTGDLDELYGDLDAAHFELDLKTVYVFILQIGLVVMTALLVWQYSIRPKPLQ